MRVFILPYTENITITVNFRTSVNGTHSLIF